MLIYTVFLQEFSHFTTDFTISFISERKTCIYINQQLR
nr:MAG TPA: hypothetical protein [Bacteriophage sp.]